MATDGNKNRSSNRGDTMNNTTKIAIVVTNNTNPTGLGPVRCADCDAPVDRCRCGARRPERCECCDAPVGRCRCRAAA